MYVRTNILCKGDELNLEEIATALSLRIPNIPHIRIQLNSYK